MTDQTKPCTCDANVDSVDSCERHGVPMTTNTPKHTPVDYQAECARILLEKPPAMIVKAVNGHGALVEALRGLFEHCSMVHKHWGEGCNQKEADAAIKAARAALKQVEETTP